MAKRLTVGHQVVRCNAVSSVISRSWISPDATAVLSYGERVTYADLIGRTHACAADLRERGIDRGDSVVSIADNTVNALVLYLALAQLGAVNVPVSSGPRATLSSSAL